MKTFGELTGEEKYHLLMAKLNGATLEYGDAPRSFWLTMEPHDFNFRPTYYYRLKPDETAA